ncbi:polyphosphate kinase 1 [Verrucomicrobiota bacterium]
MAGRRGRFLNRELSWLEFNQRVLDEAGDESVPLLERLNFLSITASNLDEFFMVRVGGLQLLLAKGDTRRDPSELTPGEQLALVNQRAHRITRDQYVVYRDVLEPALADQGIRRLLPEEATDAQRSFLENVFEDDVFPVVTPMAVRDGESFPLLVNLGLNIAARLEPSGRGKKPRFAVIPAGPGIARFIHVPSSSAFAYVLVEDLVSMFIERLFPGEKVLEAAPFRITRNADLSVREDLSDDLLAEMESVLRQRKISPCVRLELAAAASDTLRGFLRSSLDVHVNDIYPISGPLDLSAFRRVTRLKGFSSLKYGSWPPQPAPNVDTKRPISEQLRQRDVLLFHPYESFEPVVRLIDEASRDPNVLAIKQILYRTSADSPIVAALKRAAENGKYVTVLVEIKARFDEAQNIEWARELEEAGGQVIYGIKGLKTHAKLCIVVRREATGIVRDLHFGTGNYNESTARLYSDVGYLTRNEDLASDASMFFNAISGYSQQQPFLKLASAPNGLRKRILELITGETQRQKQGQKGLIMAKLNSLVDPEVIEALYTASRAGVEILLNVRGICCLRPGLKVLSRNITVLSTIDRFLEHSRILYFHRGGAGRGLYLQRGLDASEPGPPHRASRSR